MPNRLCFDKGQNFYLQGHYEQASTAFEDFLKTYPESIITDLTLLWLGRSYLQLGNYQQAEQVHQRMRLWKDTPFLSVYEDELKSLHLTPTTLSYRLVLSNEGSGIAKNLSVLEQLPESLEFVSSNPSLNAKDASGAQRFTWNVAELAPCATSVLITTVRFKGSPQSSAQLRLRHALFYQDLNSNNYQSNEVAENLDGASQSKGSQSGSSIDSLLKRTQSGQPIEKKNISQPSSSDSRKGSRITITSDGVLSEYSAYRSGDRYYVVIPKTEAAGAKSGMRGRGFDDFKVQKNGNDTVLSLHLQPGAKARVESNLANKLDIVVEIP